MSTRPMTRSTAILVALAACAVVVPTSASSGAATSPHAADACRSTWVRASIASVRTTPTVTGLALAETNVSGHRCDLASPLEVQLLGLQGQKVIPAVKSPPFTRGSLLDTYQGAFSMSLVNGRSCRRHPLATSVQVTSGDATSRVRLEHWVHVCASGPHPETVSPVTFPHPAPCPPGTITASIGAPNGALGTIYYAIRFRSIDAEACTVHGTPSAQPVEPDGAAVGPASYVDHVAGRGRAMVLGVGNGVDAYSQFGVTDTGNFPPARCDAAAAGAVRVTLPGYAPMTVPLAFTTCTRLASTSIDGVAPGWPTG